MRKSNLLFHVAYGKADKRTSEIVAFDLRRALFRSEPGVKGALHALRRQKRVVVDVDVIEKFTFSRLFGDLRERFIGT